MSVYADKIEENWICENCLEILGAIVDDNTQCSCCDQIYGIAWSRIDNAQACMDECKINKNYCSEREDCDYYKDDGFCYEKCASYIERIESLKIKE